MRERLIELLRDTFNYTNSVCIDFDEAVEINADYLLENGVVALPCKVGDDVYVIEPCTCFNNYRSFEECHRRRTAATKWIDIVNVQKKHHKKCLKLFIRPFKIEYLNKVGKTVFLSREDAERALRKEGEEK